MINKDITSRDEYVWKHTTMYNKIINTWDYDILTEMEENLVDAFYDYRDSYFLFSKDIKHVWLITESGYDYDYAFTDNKDLLYNLVADNDYSIKNTAKLLGIKPTDVLNAINKPELLNYLLPRVEVEDIVSK